jgi:hypothetical protein
MLLAVLFGEQVGGAGEAVLSVELAPDLRCPEPRTLSAALDSRWPMLHAEPNAEARARFHLAVQPHGPHGVTLRLRDGDTLLVERSLEVAPHECDKLADTLALIAETWVNTPARDAPGEAEASSALISAAAESPTQLLDEPMPASVTEVQGASQPMLPTASIATAPPVPTAHATQGVPDRAASKVLDQLTLGAAAGTVLASDGEVVPSVAVGASLEAWHRRWRFGLRGHFETARNLDEQGTISLRHAPLEGYVGGALASFTLVDIVLLAGLGLDVISSHVTGYERSGTSHALAPLASLSLRSAWRLHPAFSLFVAADILLNLRRERFVSEGETLATTLRPRLRFTLGASWHVF